MSCIAVIIIHVSGIYKGAFIDKEEMLKLDTTHLFGTTMWNIFSRFAVPCFVMLSGAFLLSNDKNQNYRNFYNKSIKKIGIPLILFSILFTLMKIVKNMISEINIAAFLNPIKALITGEPYYHLWYLYMIVGIYMLTPIVIRFKNSISKENFAKVSWIFLIVSCLSGFTSNYTLQWDIGRSFLYLGYFMIGYVLKQKYENKKNKVKGIIFILLGLLVEYIIVPIQYNHTMLGMKENMEKYTLIGNFNPIILIYSVLLFAGFANINIKKDISKLSNLTFYIYIFHAFIIKISFAIFQLIGLINKDTNSNIVILLETIFVFIVSYICSILWNKIWNLINKNNRIYNKIDKII